MIVEVTAGIAAAKELVKSANELKKKDFGKQPDEIDELDLLRAGLTVAEVATSGGVTEIASDCLKVEDVKALPEAIGDVNDIPSLDELPDMPNEINDEHLSDLAGSDIGSEIPIAEEINGNPNDNNISNELFEKSDQEVSISETSTLNNN